MLSWKIGSNAACPPNPGSASERPSREWGLDKILQNRLGLWAVHKCAQRAVVRTNSRSRIWKGIHDKGMIMTQRGIKTKYKNQKKNLQASKKGDPGGPRTVEEQVTLMVSSFSTSSFLSAASKQDSHALSILNPIFLLAVSIQQRFMVYIHGNPKNPSEEISYWTGPSNSRSLIELESPRSSWIWHLC